MMPPPFIVRSIMARTLLHHARMHAILLYAYYNAPRTGHSMECFLHSQSRGMNPHESCTRRLAWILSGFLLEHVPASYGRTQHLLTRRSIPAAPADVAQARSRSSMVLGVREIRVYPFRPASLGRKGPKDRAADHAKCGVQIHREICTSQGSQLLTDRDRGLFIV